jgi:hypothetical protein
MLSSIVPKHPTTGTGRLARATLVPRRAIRTLANAMG